MKLNNSKVILPVLFSILLALIALLTFFIYSIRANNRETSELLYKADEAARVEVLARSIRADQSRYREEIEIFKSFVLTESQTIPLIESIENAGATLGLETNVISVEKIVPKKDEGPPYILEMELGTAGSWSGTIAFLKALESLPTRVDIRDVNVYKQDDDWFSRISLELYIFD